jgi:hypothetical protein
MRPHTEGFINHVEECPCTRINDAENIIQRLLIYRPIFGTFFDAVTKE